LSALSLSFVYIVSLYWTATFSFFVQLFSIHYVKSRDRLENEDLLHESAIGSKEKRKKEEEEEEVPERMSVRKLYTNLAKNGLSLDGTKDALIKRLSTHYEKSESPCSISYTGQGCCLSQQHRPGSSASSSASSSSSSHH